MSDEIPVRGDTIRLGQLLKLAGLVESGGEARAFLADHDVRVNGEREDRRGRQVARGDEVRIGERTLKVV